MTSKKEKLEELKMEMAFWVMEMTCAQLADEVQTAALMVKAIRVEIADLLEESDDDL
jgi:hypothetical protein